jgi:hypothetical protein
VYGPEASGKTTLALHVIAEAQKLGGGGKPKTSYLTSISYSAFLCSSIWLVTSLECLYSYVFSFNLCSWCGLLDFVACTYKADFFLLRYF